MISNGFDETLVMNAAINRIGFRNGYGDYAIVDSDNQTASSGRYFQDFHAAVTVQNLKQTQEYAEITNEQFNGYLLSLKKSVVNAALNSVFAQPQELDHPRMFFDRLPNTNYQPIANSGKFVGWRLNIAKGFYAARINSATFFFDANATFNLYLFQDGKIAPIQTKAVEVTANDLTVVELTDWTVRAVTGSNYYIGYFQNDIGEAVAQDVSLMDLQRFNIIGFQAMEAIPNGDTNFDRVNIAPNWKTYGLNLEVSTYRDFTNEIVKNIHLFDNMVGLQMAMKVIEQLQYNNRSNSDQRIASEQMSMRIDRDLNQAIPVEGMPFVAGLKAQYSKELSRVWRTFFPKPSMTTSRPDCQNNDYPYNLVNPFYPDNVQ